MHLPPACICPKMASPENTARRENAFPHSLIVQTTEAFVGDESVTLLGRSLFCQAWRGMHFSN